MRKLLLKAEKLRRYWTRRLRPPSDIPFFWHVGRPNFGDDLNPLFFETLANCGVRFAGNRDVPHFLGIGSILDRARPASTVLGSGFLVPPPKSVPQPAKIVAVRGALSRAALGDRQDIWLGDPLVLADLVRPPPAAKTYRYGYVPHVSTVARARTMLPADALLIDPSAPPWLVLDRIASCETIVSQSLHGLIVADAYGIPNIWVAPSDAMAGGRFKFDDYFSTLDAPKDMFPETADLLAHPPADAFRAGVYAFDKIRYRQILADAVAQGPAALREPAQVIAP